MSLVLIVLVIAVPACLAAIVFCPRKKKRPATATVRYVRPPDLDKDPPGKRPERMKPMPYETEVADMDSGVEAMLLFNAIEQLSEGVSSVEWPGKSEQSSEPASSAPLTAEAPDPAADNGFHYDSTPASDYSPSYDGSSYDCGSSDFGGGCGGGDCGGD